MPIGNIQWLDSIVEFPLKNAGNLGGLFSDASFITYDNFVPALTNISISGDNLLLTFKFDDGVQSFSCPISSAIEYNTFRIKNANRSYGTVVFGRLISD